MEGMPLQNNWYKHPISIGVYDPQGQPNRKSRASARSVALRKNLAAEMVNRCFGDRQSETEPAKFPRNGPIPLPERLENVLQLARGDSNSVITDRDDHNPRFIGRSQKDFALRGRELGSVLQNVPKDLLQARRITEHLGLDRLQVKRELLLLLFELGLANISGSAKHFVCIDRDARQLELSA